MNISKQIRNLAMLSLSIIGTVAPMEQPAIQDPLPQEQVQLSNSGWGLYQLKNGFNYYIYSPLSSFGTTIGSAFGFNSAAINKAEDRENVQHIPQNNDIHNLTTEEPINQEQKNNLPTDQESPKEKHQPQDSQTQQQKTAPLIKNPTFWYYLVGGSVCTSSAAIVYKAIDYLRLNGVKRNLSSLDDLIDVANANEDQNLAALYEEKKGDLTLLVDSEKGLLQHLLPEKTKFIETATKIKQALPERVKESMLMRISYGIKDDVKRAQGCWDRARNAIKDKLGKIFKGMKR